jgi:hypothetical protein
MLPSHRPETVESLFLAYRLTGEQKYRDYGWTIFQAFREHCRLPGGGYAGIANVDHLPVQHEDKMETFWLVSLPLTTMCVAHTGLTAALICRAKH